jgi:hypothetical protein
MATRSPSVKARGKPLAEQSEETLKAKVLKGSALWETTDRQALAVALEYGPDVQALKKTVRSGGRKWEQYVRDELPQAPVTYARWMRLAKNRATLEQWCRDNGKRLKHLGYFQALGILPKGKRRGKTAQAREEAAEQAEAERTQKLLTPKRGEEMVTVRITAWTQVPKTLADKLYAKDYLVGLTANVRTPDGLAALPVETLKQKVGDHRESVVIQQAREEAKRLAQPEPPEGSAE